LTGFAGVVAHPEHIHGQLLVWVEGSAGAGRSGNAAPIGRGFVVAGAEGVPTSIERDLNVQIALVIRVFALPCTDHFAGFVGAGWGAGDQYKRQADNQHDPAWILGDPNMVWHDETIPLCAQVKFSMLRITLLLSDLFHDYSDREFFRLNTMMLALQRGSIPAHQNQASYATSPTTGSSVESDDEHSQTILAGHLRPPRR
jgi:hypothetical protein